MKHCSISGRQFDTNFGLARLELLKESGVYVRPEWLEALKSGRLPRAAYGAARSKVMGECAGSNSFSRLAQYAVGVAHYFDGISVTRFRDGWTRGHSRYETVRGEYSWVADMIGVLDSRVCRRFLGENHRCHRGENRQHR